MHEQAATARSETLYVAIEMRTTQWRLALTVGAQIRQGTIMAGAYPAFAPQVRLGKYAGEVPNLGSLSG